jgi:PKD repeat protein
MRRIASGFWLSVLVLAATSARAQDLSTTNINMLTHFWAAAQATNRPVTVVSFGDSMADSYRSVAFSVINMMVDSIGVAGYSLNPYGNAMLHDLANGAQVVTGPTPLWFSDYYQLPPGSALWWIDLNSPSGVYSDKLGIFWVAQPQGGQMTFSASTDQGAWTPVLTLNGYAAVATGQYTNVVVTPDFHQIRVDGVTGTNYVIGPQLLLQTTSGVHVVFMDKGGINLGDVTNVSPAIRAPIFAALSPDLLIWHMKEDDQPLLATSNRLISCEQWWSNAAPACDVVYIGTPYKAADTNATPTTDQNQLVRFTALQYHRAYCDLMDPSISWPWMNSLGFMADDVHEDYDGGLYLAGFMWNELFYALGAGVPPSADFTATPTNGEIPMSVTFADISSGSITNWYWNFGDGSTTNLTTKSVSYTYATPGTYSVTEIVSGPGGSATNTQSNYITAVTPSYNFTATPTNGVIPLTVSFLDTSVANITNRYWIFGDGITTNVPPANYVVVHTYTIPGTYTVTEILSGPGGSVTNTQPNYITAAWPPPLAGFTTTPTFGVAPLTVNFNDASTGGPITIWSWDFGDNSSAIVTTTSVSHTYTTAGNFTVTETVSGPGGSNTATRINYIIVLNATEASQFQSWLTRYFNCTNCVESQMNTDADGTGQNNLFKYTAGLDPTNPASVFLVNPASVQNAPGQFSFQFSPVATGRVYAPQFCTNLVSGVWLPLMNYAGPMTNGIQATITDLDATQPNKFYRLAVALPINLQPFAITSIIRTGQSVNLVWNGQPGTNLL